MDRKLRDATRRAWEANADYWDEHFGEGNDYQRLLIGPATERLLGLRSGERVLDVACGNGAFARRMADLGAEVLGIDQSERMVEHARRRSVGIQGLEFRQIDAADEQALTALGDGRFDAVVGTMALMDMASIDELARAIPRLLRAGGRFVFSVLHPCFGGSGATRFAEERYEKSGVVTHIGVKVSRYLSAWHELGNFMTGQPEPHLYYNRPISALLAPFFAAGFSLDGLEEPSFAPPAPERSSLWSHRRLHEIPPILVVRLRPIPR